MLGPVEKFLRVDKVEPIRMVGGGARSALWCQILADILDRRVIQVRDPQWVNARGAAFIAAVGLGEISFADIPALVADQMEFAPDPRNRALYDERYEIFVEIYRKNKDIYARLNRPKS
jgi:xylulokinase